MKSLIGLTGPAGSGKDTIGDLLQLEYGFCRYSFARPIKLMLETLGFPLDEFDHRDKKEQVIEHLGVSYRQMAQTLGTEWGRSLNKDFWLLIGQQFFEKQKIYGKFRGMVVTDVRFENEAEWIRENGTLIHVTGRRAELGGQESTHSSEAGIIFQRGDAMIVNGGTKADLYTEVRTVMRKLGHG